MGTERDRFTRLRIAHVTARVCGALLRREGVEEGGEVLVALEGLHEVILPIGGVADDGVGVAGVVGGLRLAWTLKINIAFHNFGWAPLDSSASARTPPHSSPS